MVRWRMGRATALVQAAGDPDRGRRERRMDAREMERRDGPRLM
jgi:hypothetical protein